MLIPWYFFNMILIISMYYSLSITDKKGDKKFGIMCDVYDYSWCLCRLKGKIFK